MKKGCHVKIFRPEELYRSPNEYYTRERVLNYLKSSAMEKIQKEITYKLIDLLEISPPGKALDLGCGVGFSTEILTKLGFEVIGIDINRYMVEEARKRGINAIEGDFRYLENYFSKNFFDLVISVSALQWIKDEKDMKRVAEGIYYVLKNSGKAGIQFYPFSEEELNKFFKTFIKVGFNGQIYVENPQSPRKRLIYMLFQKNP
jgi:18S rRNA (guanine1575-N7)-methyltransferase